MRYWKVFNENQRNAVGDPVGYKLQRGANVHHSLQGDAPALKPAGFITHHL